MSTSVALSNNQPTVYLQQFGSGASAPSSSNSVAPNNINNNSTTSLVPSPSPSPSTNTASQTSKSHKSNSSTLGTNSTSSIALESGATPHTSVTPATKGDNNSSGVETTSGTVTNPNSGSKPPPHCQANSPQISLSSSGRALQQPGYTPTNSSSQQSLGSAKTSSGVRPLHYSLGNRPASAIVSSSSSHQQSDYSSFALKSGGGLTSSSSSCAVSSSATKGQQQAQMNQPYPVPDTLLNSAFMLPTATTRRRSDALSGSMNSPLFSQSGSLNSSSMFDMSVPSSPVGQPGSQTTSNTPRQSLTGIPIPSVATAPSLQSITGALERGPSPPTSNPDYVRRLEEENSLMCEELQATVVELSEARELSKQLALQRDQGEARLQIILRCIYEQNTVLDQCCGQMDFLRALVDDSSSSGGAENGRKTKPGGGSVGGGDIDGLGSSVGGLDGSTDEEADTEKTPEEVSASCVRKLNRLEVLLKHKLKEDRTMRNEMKKTNQALRDREMEVEMLKVRLEASQQRKTSPEVEAMESEKKEPILNTPPAIEQRKRSETCLETSRLGTNASASVVEALSTQYEELLRRKEEEIKKLREELQKTLRNAKAVESIRRLNPVEADRDELILLQDRIDKLTKEKHDSETSRDTLNRELIRSKAEMTSQIESLAAQLQEIDQERQEWKKKFEQIEKEIQQMKHDTHEKMADMYNALCAAEDFQNEATQDKELAEAELEGVKKKLFRVESEYMKQRTENESLKRNLESERESHKVELSNAQKHAEELSTNVHLLKQQIVDSRKTEATMPKVQRVQSMLEPGASERRASYGNTRRVAGLDQSDNVDTSPMPKNVKSMIRSIEVPSESTFSRPSDSSSHSLSGITGSMDDLFGGGSCSPKPKRLTGGSKHDKRRTAVQNVATSGAPPGAAGSSRLEAIADEPSSPSAVGAAAVLSGSGYRLSPSLRSKREKFESSDEVMTPSHVNKPPRSSRQVSSVSSLEASRAFRSPLNKLKINDIVVTRGSVARDKRAATVVGNHSPSPAATNSGSSSSAQNSDSESANHAISQSTTGSTATTASNGVTQTHVISDSTAPIVTIGGGSNDPVPGTENKALKELMQKGNHVSVRNALLDWCKEVTAKFPAVEVTNFSSSWNDGLAFCALFYSSCSPEDLRMFPKFESLIKQSKKQNFHVACAIAKTLGIQFDLDVEKIIRTERPDWKTILPLVRSIFEGLALRNQK